MIEVEMQRMEAVGAAVAADGEEALRGNGLREMMEGALRDMVEGIGEKGWRKEK